MIHDLNKFPCFSLDNSFSESALIDPDHRSPTGHTLDWRHPEVLIHRDIDRGYSSSDK
jgi:hypothetical protein